MTVTKEEKPKGLAAKLSEVMGLMQALDKKGFNKAQHYSFVRESDVAERASNLLAERHIFIQQSVSGWNIQELYRTSSGSMMWLTTVMMEFTFIDADSGETLGPVMFPGHGADTGDKGIYKAMTGAEKYFLMKTFLISTGDDPEADEKVDKAAAASGATQGATRVTASSQKGVQRGGKSDTATAAQVREVAVLTKKLGLDATTVIPVVARVLGLSAADAEGISDTAAWLGTLPSKDIATLIGAMQQTIDATVEETVEEVGTDEGLNLVEAARDTFDIA